MMFQKINTKEKLMESFEIGMDLLKILPKFNMALAGDIGPQDIKDTAPI